MMLLNVWSPFLLLLSLLPSATAQPSEILLKFSYQSKNISFSDWVSLFTLCLSPLAVHIIAGTPEVVCLSHTRKHLTWHHRFCLYHPTTILWRYFVIADRRVRAKAWSAADMAASNALFWTPRGWDGSEEIIQRSRLYCLKFPDNSRATIFSKSFVKTVVVTIQGVQAIIVLLRGFTTSSVFVANIAIDTIFFPLAVLGLLRLFAAPWLTEDYFYAEYDNRSTMSALKQRSASSQTTPYSFDDRTLSTIGLVDPTEYSTEIKFRPVNSWRARLFRLFFLIPILLLWVMSLRYMIPPSNDGPQYMIPTILLLNIFYMLFLTGTIMIYAYYFIRGRSATTIIPCIVSTWYKIYTCIFMVMVLVLIVFAALETRKTVCGTYTVWPVNWTTNDEWNCGGPFIKTYLNSSSIRIPENTTRLL